MTSNLLQCSVRVCRFVASSILGRPHTLPEHKSRPSNLAHGPGSAGTVRDVGLVRLSRLLLSQPRSLNSSPVAIGRVVAPGCFSLFLLSSQASSAMPCRRMWLPGTGNAGFEPRDRAPQRNSTLHVYTFATTRHFVVPHTGTFESQMPDREPVSGCTSQPSENFRLGIFVCQT